MTSSKVIVAISDLWNEKQLAAVKGSLLRGFNELNKKAEIGNIIADLSSQQVSGDNVIELSSCSVKIMTRVDKPRLLEAIVECGRSTIDSMILIYVGEIAANGGQWLLAGGVVKAMDVLQGLNNDGCKVWVAAPVPCEDWVGLGKRRDGVVGVCGYGSEGEEAGGLGAFVDSICRGLAVTPGAIRQPESTSVLKVTKPSVCGFFDRSCSSMPCLFLIDGFSMLLNIGSGRLPEAAGHLKYLPQLDAALLTHIGYDNLLGLSSAARDPDGIKLGHLFLPPGVVAPERVIAENEAPFLVDLGAEVAELLSGCHERDTGVTHLSAKGRGASKPVPLFLRIGSGSLELVPILPCEEDLPDSRKGKAPGSVTVLLLWRPFSPGVAVKRFLYVGGRHNLRARLPAAVAALLQAHDCLQAPKKAAVAKKTNGTAAEAPKKLPRPTTAPEPAKKPPASTPATARPTTATVAKKPLTATTKSHAEPNKAPEPHKTTENNKTSEPKKAKGINGAADPKKTTDNNRSTDAKKTTDNNKATEPKKTKGNSGSADSKKTTENNRMADPKKAPEANKTVTRAKKAAAGTGAGVNGDKDAHPATPTAHGDGDVLPGGAVAPVAPVVVAVGTVESAITEHEEVGFCEEPPQELSAEQMEAMGLYDDDDDDDDNGEEDSRDPGTGAGTTDLAHLPMEGSIYVNEDIELPQPWTQPLGLPMPTRAAVPNGGAKRPSKGASPIHVDCLCVPSDLDKEDLRCLFGLVRFETAFVQLERCGDLAAVVEALLEEWAPGGANKAATVIPSLDDADTAEWLDEHRERLAAGGVHVAPALSRCSIVIGGVGAEGAPCGDGGSCLGFRCDL